MIVQLKCIILTDRQTNRQTDRQTNRLEQRSIFSSTSTEGFAASRKEQTKSEKYSMERLPGKEAVRLVPLVLEHFGHWGQQAEKYLHQLSIKSTDEHGKNNNSQFKIYWRERLLIQLQKSNGRVIYRKVEGLAR